MGAHQQLLYHIVFSVKKRMPLLQDDSLREETWAYMAGISKKLGGFAIRVGGYHDHAHLLVRIPAKVSVSTFIGKVKASTSKHINNGGKLTKKFHWQDSYGAFTVSPSKKDRVVRYIENQVRHHRQFTFQEEFLLLLERHEIEFTPEYLWE